MCTSNLLNNTTTTTTTTMSSTYISSTTTTSLSSTSCSSTTTTTTPTTTTTTLSGSSSSTITTTTTPTATTTEANTLQLEVYNHREDADDDEDDHYDDAGGHTNAKKRKFGELVKQHKDTPIEIKRTTIKTPTLYDSLWLHENCSTEQVVCAFQALSLHLHSDKTKGDDELLKKLTETYNTFSYPEGSAVRILISPTNNTLTKFSISHSTRSQ